MNSFKRIIAYLTAVVFFISLNIQPSVAVPVDFEIKGPILRWVGTGDYHQLDYVTSGIPYEFYRRASVFSLLTKMV